MRSHLCRANEPRARALITVDFPSAVLLDSASSLLFSILLAQLSLFTSALPAHPRRPHTDFDKLTNQTRHLQKMTHDLIVSSALMHQWWMNEWMNPLATSSWWCSDLNSACGIWLSYSSSSCSLSLSSHTCGLSAHLVCINHGESRGGRLRWLWIHEGEDNAHFHQAKTTAIWTQAQSWPSSQTKLEQ